MTPRFASLLTGLALALTSSVLPLPAADPSASLGVPQPQVAVAPATIPQVAAAPATIPQVAATAATLAACPAPDAAITWDLLAPQPAAANCQQMCDALCAPLQGRCKAGSCFCLRDPL